MTDQPGRTSSPRRGAAGAGKAALSKSRLMSSRQCLKRVHLEAHHPELRRFSPQAEAAFAIGHRVGEVAIEALGGRAGDNPGTYVDYDGRDLAPALDQTRALMAAAEPAPLYEATLQHQGVLVREDLLFPTAGGSWRIVEVKAATKLKDEYIEDCAIQAWVHEGAGYPLERIALAHVNNQWVRPEGDSLEGLFTEVDLTDQVQALKRSVPGWVDAAREAIAGPQPRVGVGHHCYHPLECPFIHHCWGAAVGDARYPVQGLGGSKKQHGEWIARGYTDIRDVPAAEIDSEQQLRIHRVTVRGEPELLPGARAFIETLPETHPGPRFYLDFETIGSSIPLWPGTRPYQALPFQYSCHIERADGDRRQPLEHREFLDLSGDPPMRALAEQLIRDLETEGPVLMYTNFEARAIRTLADLLPDFAEPLEAILARLVDLHPVVKQNYYHPDMLGSWSIKDVLPTIAPELDYHQLEGIKEGMGAAEAYLEAIDPATPPERKAQIEEELLRYCKHDTEAMVRLVGFLGGAAF